MFVLKKNPSNIQNRNVAKLNPRHFVEKNPKNQQHLKVDARLALFEKIWPFLRNRGE